MKLNTKKTEGEKTEALKTILEYGKDNPSRIKLIMGLFSLRAKKHISL